MTTGQYIGYSFVFVLMGVCFVLLMLWFYYGDEVHAYYLKIKANIKSKLGRHKNGKR